MTLFCKRTERISVRASLGGTFCASPASRREVGAGASQEMLRRDMVFLVEVAGQAIYNFGLS